MLLVVGWALGQENPYVEALDQARAAILVADWKAADASLARADTIAPTSPVLLPGGELARLDYYRGVIAWNSGNRDEALPLWRNSATLNPKFQPLPDVLPDTEGQDAYYALVSEVVAYRSRELAVPDDITAVIFVDGIRPEPDQEVPEGRHFIQIRCDDTSLRGAWYEFGPPPPDYLVLCSGGAYPVPRREPATHHHPRNGTRLVGWTLLASGAGLLGTAAYWNFVVTNPLWNQGVVANQNPGSLTAAQADQLVADFNTNRTVVIGLLAAGVLTTAPGIALGPLQIRIATPTTVALNGSW